MDFWGILGGAATSYLDVLKQQQLAKTEIEKARALTELERTRIEAARVTAEAPSWQKYLPWAILAGVAYFAFKKK